MWLFNYFYVNKKQKTYNYEFKTNKLINCENLTKNFICQKHDKHVDITTL